MPTGSPQALLPPVPRTAPLSTPSSAASRGAQLLRAGRALRRRTPPALRRSPLMRHLLPSSPPQIVAAATPVTTPRGRPWEEVAAEAVALASTLSSPWALFTGSGAVAEALGAGAPPTTPSGRGAAPEAPGVATNTSADAAPRQVDPVLPPSQGVRRVSPPLSPPPGSTSASSPLSSAPPTPEGFGALSPSSPSTQAPRPTAFQAKWLERLEEATSWADFEAAVAALTREMEPPRRAQQRRGPPPRRQQDPRRLQQLYRSSRAKAMRVVREEASPMCDLPAEEVAAHFEEVFSNRLPALSAAPEGAVLPPTQACDPSLVAPFTREEVLARLQHCSDTAPGPDGIRYSTIKRRDRGVLVTLIILNRCLREGRIPVSWKGARTVLIYKKGDKKDLSNWRPISLCDCFYKLFTGILAARLGRWAAATGAVSPCQKGFMPSEGCLEHNFALQQCIDEVKVSSRHLAVAWLDLRNAFGSVPHSCATLVMHKKKTVRFAASIQGQEIPSLNEEDAYQHLGVPTGCSVDQTPEATLKTMLRDLHKIERSVLSDWQKIDAIRTFVVPQVEFCLLTARVRKAPLSKLDAEIKRVVKGAFHLPRRASPEVVFLPSWQGGANILPLSDLADIGAVTKAFKVLTCPDSLVRDIAESSATRSVTRYLGREAYPVDLAAYLSGCTDDGHSKSSATVWTAARSASRRLAAKIPGLCWEWSPTLSRMSIVVPLPGRSPDRNVVDCMSRSELHSTLRRGVQHHYHLQLAAKPDQGKVHDVAAREPTSNHFLAAGRFTRFCDWRFVHRARLGVLPLKACIRVPGADKVCRKCRAHPETTAHVLCHCAVHSRAWNNRHRSVLKHTIENMNVLCREKLSVEKTVAGFPGRLLPDIVICDEAQKKAVIVDVCCPFENRYVAFEEARQRKRDKYAPLADYLQGLGLTVVCDALVVGSLGCWDPANDKVLTHLGIDQQKRTIFKRKVVSDVIRWSRDIYTEHVSNHRQYKTDVILPILN
ncbi:hypothetical protein KUF71_002617 [Frankliniella fusca]|uniref:Reverse transcriptase domain-containing protein n=1 Tax=Frankliniella fusca TaxID=407009 RepID=A0AAE1HR08_9NEOP|nr:hypothetical protein KUF71_002617 [Frankliniella fusca]